MLECFDTYCPSNASYRTNKEDFNCNRQRCIDDEDQAIYGGIDISEDVGEEYE